MAGFARPTPGRADAIASLRVRLDALGEVVFEATLPTQAPHGDVSLGNLLHTPQRLVWNDFEDTLRGPVHWDLAGYVISLRTRGASSERPAQTGAPAASMPWDASVQIT